MIVAERFARRSRRSAAARGARMMRARSRAGLRARAGASSRRRPRAQAPAPRARRAAATIAHRGAAAGGARRPSTLIRKGGPFPYARTAWSSATARALLPRAEARLLSRVHGEDARRAHARRTAHHLRARAASSTTPTTTTTTSGASANRSSAWRSRRSSRCSRRNQGGVWFLPAHVERARPCRPPRRRPASPSSTSRASNIARKEQLLNDVATALRLPEALRPQLGRARGVPDRPRGRGRRATSSTTTTSTGCSTRTRTSSRRWWRSCATRWRSWKEDDTRDGRAALGREGAEGRRKLKPRRPSQGQTTGMRVDEPDLLGVTSRAVGEHLDAGGDRLAQRAAVLVVDAVGGPHLASRRRAARNRAAPGAGPAAFRRISSRRCRAPRSLTQSGKSATPRDAAAVTFFTST